MSFETADIREHLKQFELPDVRFTGQKLGTGSYGIVEVVEIPGALCAAKTLHELLVQSVAHVQQGQRGSHHGGRYVPRSIVDGFVTECTLMSTLRHPHIVQFLGICYPPDAQLPALVMELLMTSLYNLLLNQSTPDIPVSIKHSFLRDVARGLVFLHSRSVIHRDLTASNILIDSSLTAKIADLGMARLLNIEAGKQAATMTKGPGNAVYMPPEAKDGLITKYGKPIDTFSMGNLILFTATQERPDPLNPTYFDEQSGTMKARTERERRVNSFHLLEQMYGKEHLFVLLATQCLQDNPRARPTAPEILKCLEKMPVIPYRDWSSSKLELVQRVISNEQEHQTAPAKNVSEIFTPNIRLMPEYEGRERQFHNSQGGTPLKQVEPTEPVKTTPVHQLNASPALLGKPNQKDVSRDVIVEAILAVRVKPGQPIQQVQVPFKIIQWSKKFGVQAPNVLSGSEPYRFKVLYCMESGRSIYDLLIDDAANTKLVDAEAKIVGWKEASEAILHYALNLLLAPNCPEFKRLKLSRSHYVCQVAKKLRGAEEILVAMGFERIAGFQELEYKDDVDNLHVAETAADLVILDGELTRVKGLVSHVCKEDLAISLTHILQARAHPTEIFKHAIDRAAVLAKSNSFPPPPVVHHSITDTPMAGCNSPQLDQKSPHLLRGMNTNRSSKDSHDYINSSVLDSTLPAVESIGKRSKNRKYENLSMLYPSPHTIVKNIESGDDHDYKNASVNVLDSNGPRSLPVSTQGSSPTPGKPPVASPRTRKTFVFPEYSGPATHTHSSYTKPNIHSLLDTNKTSKYQEHDDGYDVQQQDPSTIERRPRRRPLLRQSNNLSNPCSPLSSLRLSEAAVDQVHMYSDRQPLSLSNIDEDASTSPEEEDSLINSLEPEVVWRQISHTSLVTDNSFQTNLLNRQSFHGSLSSFEMVMDAPYENYYSLVPTSNSTTSIIRDENISQGQDYPAKTKSKSTPDLLADVSGSRSPYLLQKKIRPRSNALLPSTHNRETIAGRETAFSNFPAEHKPGATSKTPTRKRSNTYSDSEVRAQSVQLSKRWLRKLKRSLTYRPQN